MNIIVASLNIQLNLMNIATRKLNERACSLPWLCFKSLSSHDMTNAVPSIWNVLFPAFTYFRFWFKCYLFNETLSYYLIWNHSFTLTPCILFVFLLDFSSLHSSFSNIVYFHLCICFFFSPLEIKLHHVRNFALLYSLLYSLCLPKQWLALTGCSINNC